MQTLKLIGWPSATGRGTWQIIGKSDLSTIILSGTTGNLGDITGKGAGAARAARAVGVGEDEEIRRAARELDLLARSAWVGELIASERSLGAALMLLAGGREFLAGMSVRLNGNGMTPRAARYLKDKRGRVPSDTSLEEAAATAAAAMVARIPSFESGMDCGLGFEFTAAALRESAGLRSHFAGVAWRAAFHSLDGDMGDGTTGRQAGQHFVGVSLALQAGQLQSQRASLVAGWLNCIVPLRFGRESTWPTGWGPAPATGNGSCQRPRPASPQPGAR
jgi:hypothetical protein